MNRCSSWAAPSARAATLGSPRRGAAPALRSAASWADRLRRTAIGLGVGQAVLAAAARPAEAQTLAVPIPAVTDPLFANLSIPSTAPTQGMWSSVMNWPLVALHVTLLPDGDVISYGTPIGQAVQEGRVFDLWNPLVPNTHRTLPNSQNVNSFCSAGTLQPAGTFLISGGNNPRDSTLFNYVTDSATTSASRLASDRWYASMIMLADGRTLITGGGLPYVTEAYANPSANLTNVSMTPEVYTPGTGWSSLMGANSRDAFGPDFNRWWYPRNWVAPNGQVFGISTEKIWYLNPAGNGSIRTVGTFKTGVDNNTRPNVGPTSTAVMYDVGRILQVGGNGYTNGFASNSSALATTFNINNGDPVIAETAAMQFARQWANATVLPNGRVLVSGGTRFADNGGSDAVFAAEMWNPQNGSWSTMSSAQIIRNYHSAAILMQNGTVLTSGGGVPGPATNFNAEIYYPPYLFRTVGGQAALADRPRMLSISSTQFGYGSSFQLEMADTRAISAVVLIGLSSTTHSFNMGQRYNPASFSQSGAMLTVTAPANANLAPPGFYQLLALDSAGVPTRGLIVSVGNAAPPSSLVAQYSFDQSSGTTVTDDSGNGKNGTLVGGASFAGGHAGNAARIAGGGQYVDLPDGLVSSCTDFTFAGWVNLAANPNWNRIFDFGQGTATNMFLTPRAGGATLRFAIKLNNGAEQQISFALDFPLNQWKHVAVVLSGNTGRLYVDGAQVAVNTNIVLNPADLGATANDWLGRSQFTADPNFNGSIDDVRISCRAFTAQEISGLAAPPPDLVARYPFDQSSGTVATDASGNGKDGTLVGGATFTAGRSGNAVRIAAGGQFVDLPDGLVSACTDFTFAGWMNLAANPNWSRIFDFGQSTATTMFLTPRAGGATLRFAIKNNNSAEQQISFGVNFALNQWRHVAVVLNGNTGTLYLDGAQVAQNTNLVLNPADLGATVNNWLGKSEFTADPNLNGSLDDVRISCRAFTAQEISALAQ